MANIYGTVGPDTKSGTSGDDAIYGWPLGGNANSLSGKDTLYGKAGNDKLFGGTGNDKLYDDAGLDSLYGGTGNDYLNGGDGNDKLYGEAGNDYLKGGKGNDYLNGGDGNDKLYGEAGNDTLNGEPGSDALLGGTGNDIYIVNSLTDNIIEFFNQGVDDLGEIIDLDYDTVRASGSYKLSNNLEGLNLTGSSNISGTGNASNNDITGNAGNNVLYGKAGNDVLSGSKGQDTLYGGTGNDSYIFDGTDTVVESSSQGIDTVGTFVSHKLGANLENLTLYGTRVINGTGNALNNAVEGNEANNYLDGSSGNDELTDYEYYDNDTLVGGAGNDSLFDVINGTLRGGAGDDTLRTDYGGSLIGGTGNDTYIVDSTTDTILEDFNAGVDTVEATFINTPGDSLSYTLIDNLENLIIDNYYGPVSGIGNALNNVISIEGGYGDINDSLFGKAGDDYLISSGGKDILKGGIGNDTLTSGFLFSNDTFTGGAGVDIFKFDSPEVGIDTITDFSVVDDTIHVSAEGFGGGLTPGAPITIAQFRIGSAAKDASDRFIYNKSTGALFFDSNGIGEAGKVQFATLSAGLAMTEANIFVT